MPVIPYVDQTWVDGSGGGTPVSAARLNQMEAGIKTAHYQPAVRVFHNVAQSIITATDTALAFNSEHFDQASNVADTQHDTVTNNSRLTCRYAGVYQISGHVTFAGNATGLRYLWIRHQGATTIDRDSALASATENSMNVSTLYPMAVNEYVELMVHQSSGGNLNVNFVGNHTPYFMMVRVA